MELTEELRRNDDYQYTLGSKQLDQEFDLDSIALTGTPKSKEIENFAALTYISSLAGHFINTFHYTKKGYLASFYKDGKFSETIIIDDDEMKIKKYLASLILDDPSQEYEFKLKIVEGLIFSTDSLFEISMKINHDIINDPRDIDNIKKQLEAFKIANNNNCEINHKLFVKKGVRDIDRILNEIIGPTYLKYRGYNRNFEKEDADGMIFEDMEVGILESEETYNKINNFSKDKEATTTVLNAMSTDCSADMVYWGLEYIARTNKENVLNTSTIEEQYDIYKDYFQPADVQNRKK